MLQPVRAGLCLARNPGPGEGLEFLCGSRAGPHRGGLPPRGYLAPESHLAIGGSATQLAVEVEEIFGHQSQAVFLRHAAHAEGEGDVLQGRDAREGGGVSTSQVGMKFVDGAPQLLG